MDDGVAVAWRWVRVMDWNFFVFSWGESFCRRWGGRGGLGIGWFLCGLFVHRVSLGVGE